MKTTLATTSSSGMPRPTATTNISSRENVSVIGAPKPTDNVLHMHAPPVGHRRRGRDDNGSAGDGSSGSTNLSGSRGSRVSTSDPSTHDQVNKIPRAGYFLAVMMFDFESTST